MSFKIVRNDIVNMDTEAIVNTANEYVLVGDGCDKNIYNNAGYDKLLSYRKENIGEVPQGEAFITPGFNLKAKYIIHAVSPAFIDGNGSEEKMLRSCYKKSLALAKDNNIKSIAFPLISTGSFGFPKEVGMRIAIDEIYDFLFDNDMEIYLVVFDENSTNLGEKLYPDLKAYIDKHYVENKENEEYAISQMRMEAVGRAPMEAEKSEKRSKGFSIFKKDRNLKSAAREFEDDGAKYLCAQPAVACEAVSKEEGYDEYEENLGELKKKLDERREHLADTFSEYLLYLISEKGLTNVQVYKDAIVDKKLFAKIKNDKTYHPQKLTCLCLCMGAKLNLDESKDLLARAGYALSPCDMRDVIFSYFIENKIYDMVELDIQLEEYGIPCIIA